MSSLCVRLLDHLKNDSNVTKMTQKFEFIATKTIEKPPLKSSTYYASIESGASCDKDFGGKTISDADGASASPQDGASVDVSAASSAEMTPADFALKSDVPSATTADEVSAARQRRDKLSEKFRRWQDDESKLYAASENSAQSPRSTSAVFYQTAPPDVDVDRQGALRPLDAETGSSLPVADEHERAMIPPHELQCPDQLSLDVDALRQEVDVTAKSRELETTDREQPIEMDICEVQEGEPNPHNALDLTDDILERNLVDAARNDERDGCEDEVETSSTVSDSKDEEQDVDLSQIVERNLPDDVEPLSFQALGNEEPISVDQVEPRVTVSGGRAVFQDVSVQPKKSIDAERTDVVDRDEPTGEKFPENADSHRDNLDTEPGVCEIGLGNEVSIPEELHQQTLSSVPVVKLDLELGDEIRLDGKSPEPQEFVPQTVSAVPGDDLNEQVGPDVVARFDQKISEPEERIVTPPADSENLLETQPAPVDETRFGSEVTEPQELMVKPDPQAEISDDGDVVSETTFIQGVTEPLATMARPDLQAEITDAGNVLDGDQVPTDETTFDSEIPDLLERAIKPYQLQYRDQLPGDVDALQQEVDTTVNSRELETTDEIVVETKVTETKTVLMHLGESGNISVMETTEVKTDTDMKETKKILERDEVAVSHRLEHKPSADRASPFIPLSPSPSPAGSLSKTPDRHSPAASLGAAGDAVEKLVEADFSEARHPRSSVGVDAGLYVAICPYDPESDDVMSLHEGEFLEILHDAAEDWWLVKKSFDGREGYVPAQYLRDKQTDDRMIEEEVAKQMDRIFADTSK